MQAAAMRCIDCLDPGAFALQPPRRQPCIGAALGAVAVQHVDLELAGEPRDFAGGPPIAETELARHGNAGEAQHAIVGEATERNRIALGAAYRK